MINNNTSEELHFLYCFDNNFNIQALTSIKSLLNNSSVNLHLHIIHENEDYNDQILATFKNDKKLSSISFHKFDKTRITLPPVKSHISEATYYRLFMADFLPNNLKNIIYLDADIICINDPVREIKNTIELMEKEETTIAALTDMTKEDNKELFERLNLKNNNYFNAGFLIVNYQKWILEDVQSKLFNIINSRFNTIRDYDQEILNIHFDDRFTKITPYLNFQAIGRNPELITEIKNNVFFLHYLGKNKPWSVEGIIDPVSNFYQNEFKKLNIEKYHITFKKNKATVKKFIKIILKLEFLKFERPGYYLFESLKKFFFN